MTYLYDKEDAYVVVNSLKAIAILAGSQIFTVSAIQFLCLALSITYAGYIGLMNYKCSILEKFQFHVDKFAISISYKNHTRKVPWFNITKVEEDEDGLVFYTNDNRIERFKIFKTLTQYPSFKEDVAERAKQHQFEFTTQGG